MGRCGAMVTSTVIVVAGGLVAACSSSSDDVIGGSAEPTETTTDTTTGTTTDTSGTTTVGSGSTGSAVGSDSDSGTGDGGSAVPAESTASFDVNPIEWESVGGSVDTATLDVPVDWADPDGATFELFLVRHRAADPDRRIGPLLVNPGGPGSEGSFLAYGAEQIYDSEIVDSFDIIAWDPRGTGQSRPPIDCIDDYDPFFTEVDSTPRTEQERRRLVDVSRRFAEECIERNEYLEFVGTNNSARDMDAIRRALGVDTVSYFGFSYGSELGATWATLFPDTVRAAVLDGAADPDADTVESTVQQLAGFEASVATFLAQCSADPGCAFHSDGDAESAFDRLMVRLDDRPVATGDPDRPPVNRDVATTAVIYSMYTDTRWPQLAAALDSARDGDGSGLMALHDGYYQRRPDGSYDNFLEAFPVIGCADDPERRSVEEVDADAPRYTEVAPRLVPEGTLGGYTCTFMPPAVDPRVAITGVGAPTVVVIGTTGDPSTPLSSTRKMTDALDDARLVVVEADQHTGYGVNRCVVEIVNEYLIDLESPQDGVRCG